MVDPTFAVAISEDVLGDFAPVLFQGGLLSGIRRAAELGYGGVELHIRDPLDLDQQRIAEAARAANIQVTAVGTGLESSRYGISMSSKEVESRVRAVQKMKQHVDFAAKFEIAPTVFVGLIRGKCSSFAEQSGALRRFADELGPLAEYATARGVPLALEPVAYYFSDLLNRTDETIAFLQDNNLDQVQLLLDSHHMFIEDDDIGAAVRAATGRIGYVHCSDSNRRYPGAGNGDFTGFFRALQEVDYQGVLSLEVLPFPSGKLAAEHGLAGMQESWATAHAQLEAER